MSNTILRELSRTLERPYFRRHLTAEEISAARHLLAEDATWTSVVECVSGVATHPEDDLVLAAAVSAQVDYLVTGDTKLQALGMYQGVIILAPRAFLDNLNPDTGAEAWP